MTHHLHIVTPDTPVDWPQVLRGFDLSRDPHYWARAAGDPTRVVILAREAATPDAPALGGLVLNFAPAYPLFARLNIPEIQDLNVIPVARRAGLGAALVGMAEAAARGKGATQIGLGVGLTANYGAAQRLYVRLGYMPDGAGVRYDAQTIPPGSMRPVDDLMCLYWIKDLT